jgi:hypothetical protein
MDPDPPANTGTGAGSATVGSEAGKNAAQTEPKPGAATDIASQLIEFEGADGRPMQMTVRQMADAVVQAKTAGGQYDETTRKQLDLLKKSLVDKDQTAFADLVRTIAPDDPFVKAMEIQNRPPVDPPEKIMATLAQEVKELKEWKERAGQPVAERIQYAEDQARVRTGLGKLTTMLPYATKYGLDGVAAEVVRVERTFLEQHGKRRSDLSPRDADKLMVSAIQHVEDNLQRSAAVWGYKADAAAGTKKNGVAMSDDRKPVEPVVWRADGFYDATGRKVKQDATGGLALIPMDDVQHIHGSGGAVGDNVNRGAEPYNEQGLRERLAARLAAVGANNQ